MATSDVERVLQEWATAWSSHDTEKVLALFTDDLGEAFKLLRHLLVDGDDFIEEAGDLAVDTVDLFRQPNGKITAAQRTERADELAAIDKVPGGLNVHSTLRVAFLPPPRLRKRSPPAATRSFYQKIKFPLDENFAPPVPVVRLNPLVSCKKRQSVRPVPCS